MRTTTPSPLMTAKLLTLGLFAQNCIKLVVASLCCVAILSRFYVSIYPAALFVYRYDDTTLQMLSCA